MKFLAARPRRPWGPDAGLLLSLLVALLPGHGSGAAVTPLQKTVQMLQGMLEAGREEKHQEQLQYAAFERFCIDISAEKQRMIQAADSRLELLRAEIERHGTEADRLAAEVRGHEARITSLQNDTEAAAAMRAEERADYEAMHQNFSESIHALTEAIAHLKRTAHGEKTDNAALVQRVLPMLSRLPVNSSQAIVAFLERNSDDPDLALTLGAAPEGPVYEFQSGGVVTMLEQLLDKFRDELVSLEREEVSRRHAAVSLQQDLKNSIEAEQTAIASKGKSRQRHLQSSTEQSADEKDTASTRADDAAYLEDLEATCAQKKGEYDARQQLRTEELSTLQQAIDILSRDEVAGAAQKHLPTLAQFHRQQRSAILAQLRSAGDCPSLRKAAEFLRTESARLDSHMLSTIAIRAQEDPFGKVKKLIEELLERLMSQATEETEHKGWCDTELATNEHTRKSKSQEVEALRSEIDGLEVVVAQLQKEVATLSGEVAELNAEVANATAIRNEEKAANVNTTREAQQAQAAVSQAIQLLKSFYSAAAANATSFAQGAADHKQGVRQEPPPIFGSEKYAGQQATSGGVLGMLDVVLSDFARLESDTATAEAQAEQAHRKFLTDSGVAKVQMEKDIQHKTADKQSKDLTLIDKKRSLEDAEQVLAGAKAEYENLKPACINTGQTYEERVQRREDEIEALKKALEILSGDGTP